MSHPKMCMYCRKDREKKDIGIVKISCEQYLGGHAVLHVDFCNDDLMCITNAMIDAKAKIDGMVHFTIQHNNSMDMVHTRYAGVYDLKIDEDNERIAVDSDTDSDRASLEK